MIYKIGNQAVPQGPVRSVVLPDMVFTAHGSKEWRSNHGATYQNFGCLLWEYPSGVEDIPEPTDPVVQAVERLREDLAWAVSDDARTVLDWVIDNHPNIEE